MLEHDLDPVMAVENAVYPHPWTRGNFKDSLREGYHCWVMEAGGEVIGYSVMMVAAGEAHLLKSHHCRTVAAARPRPRIAAIHA